MNQPLFSVVVVCLNAENTIENTIRSVLVQTHEKFEIIVKDGVSKDLTLKRIPQDERIKVFSQRDNSVYDAMNQAVAHASGKYVIFMNCGDAFHSDRVLSKMAELIADKNLSEDTIIYGNYITNGAEYKQSSIIDRKRIVSGGLCHQSVCCGRVLFDKYGGFDTEMKICADHEHMARLFVNGVPFIYLNEIICDYQGGGISERADNLELVRREGDLIRKRYFTSRDIAYYNFQRVKKRLTKARR